jgi:hypothetical protein
MIFEDVMAAGCAFCAWSRVVVAGAAVFGFCGLVAISLMDGIGVPVWVWTGLIVSVAIALKVVTDQWRASKGLSAQEVI